VASYDTIRTLLAVAASEGMKIKQFDVKTAFLYGELEEEMYLEQPEGFDDGSGHVCRLKRSLYGLKQAPRCWNKRFMGLRRKPDYKTAQLIHAYFIARMEIPFFTLQFMLMMDLLLVTMMKKLKYF
jgi:hypothetical protein